MFIILTERETTMRRSYLAIPILALLLLAAHALRQADFGQFIALVMLVCILGTRNSWVRLVCIAVLVYGGVFWAQTTIDYILFRQAFHMPWVRLTCIMGSILIVNSIALWVLNSEESQRFFSRSKQTEHIRFASFFLTISGLVLAKSMAPFPILLIDRYLPGWGWVEVMLLGYYAQALSSALISPEKHIFYRPRIWGLFSVIFFAQFFLGILGFDQMLMTGVLHLPVPALIVAGPLYRGEGYFMIILFIVTLLLVGPAWCSHLCYIGAWDDRMSRFGPRPQARRGLKQLSIIGRLVSLTLSIGGAIQCRSKGIPVLNMLIYAAAFGGLGICLMLFISRRVGMMTHCTAYCPMGLIAVILGKISLWRLRISPQCTGCGACIKKCRYNALDKVQIELRKPGYSCTLCGDCVSACKHGHIGYRLPFLSEKKAREIFIVLVVSLHAIFLGVARI